MSGAPVKEQNISSKSEPDKKLQNKLLEFDYTEIGRRDDSKNEIHDVTQSGNKSEKITEKPMCKYFNAINIHIIIPNFE